MLASRTAARAATRSLRAPIRNAKTVRLASTEQKAAVAGGSSGLVGGIAGGALVFAAGYGYYHFSGAKSIVNAASSTKAQLQSIGKNISSSAPEPNEALKWLKSTALSYAAFIPGAKGYVETAFKDLEEVQSKHGEEVEAIVQDAYKQLKAVAGKEGMSVESAARSWEIVQDAVKKLGELAGDSMSEILDNHPKVKEKVGGNLEQLKGMADRYGPEAKKELDETYKQIADVVKGGVSMESVEKIKKVIQEKMDKVQKLGDEAWKKGLEQAKPYFDKNPEVKKLVEENADALKKGNFGELFEKVKDAVSSGNTEKLQEYVKDAGEKAKNSGVGKSIMEYAKMIPGGEEILPKLQKLQEVAKKRGDDAEKILKGAYEDVQKVLEKRISEAEKLADEAKKDAKK